MTKFAFLFLFLGVLTVQAQEADAFKEMRFGIAPSGFSIINESSSVSTDIRMAVASQTGFETNRSEKDKVLARLMSLKQVTSIIDGFASNRRWFLEKMEVQCNGLKSDKPSDSYEWYRVCDLDLSYKYSEQTRQNVKFVLVELRSGYRDVRQTWIQGYRVKSDDSLEPLILPWQG